MKISACRDRLVVSGPEALLGVSASTSAMDALSNDEKMNLIYVASLNDPSLFSQLNDAQKAAYESLTGKTITSTGGTQIINPGPSNIGGDQTVTGNVPSNTGNNQSSGQGATNTGNTDGNPNTGGNTTVTPIPEGPGKDDLAYLDKPANLSPEGSARSGAFNEAKRQSGIPVSQSPSKVYPNVDKRNNPQPGYIYEFDVPRPGGGTQKVYIRDDAGGHFFTDDPNQNRGPHFNDEKGNHYDY